MGIIQTIVSEPDFLQIFLFTPPGKTTTIQKKDYPFICEYLKAGDRIAWDRLYMLIHEATVIHVSRHSGMILVLEVQKDSKLGGPLDFKEITLAGGPLEGKLYRYDYERTPTEDERVLRELLSRLGDNCGYNIFGDNCQHMTEKAHTGRHESYQTRWFFLWKSLTEPLSKSFLAELIERLGGGKEVIGIVSIFVLNVVTFLIKLVAAYQKLKGGRITWVHFTTLIFKEFLMSSGNALFHLMVHYLEVNVTKPSHCTKGYVTIVLIFMGACILDALLLWSGLISSDSSLRYIIFFLGTLIGLGIGICSTGWLFEFLLSAVLGFTAQFIAHGLYHAGSWLYSWLKGEQVDSRIVGDINELQTGDHITNYEHCFHPSCHAIFVKGEGRRKMKIIKNTYSEGVVEKYVPFIKGNVYKYLYKRWECRPGPQVLEIARSKIGGRNTYNCFTNNCKTFAKNCKCEENMRGLPRDVINALEGVNVTAIIDELLSDNNLSADKRKMYNSLKLAIIECH